MFIVNKDTFDDGGSVTYDVTTDEIEGLPTVTLYRYDLDKHLSNVVETFEYEDSGMPHVTQVATIVMKGQSAAKRKEFKAISKGRLIIFLEDNNGTIKAYGLVDGIDITAIEIASGTVKADLYGYTFTFTGDEKCAAPHLEQYTTNPFDNFGTITVSPTFGS